MRKIVVGPRGIVVFDAPNSSAQGEALIKDLEQRYPGRPIRQLVLNDLYWPHCAGVRAFVARGIPVYVAPGNEPLVRAMVDARHISRPDVLEKNRRKMTLRTITETIELTGIGRQLVVAPLRGYTSSRMVAAYVPDCKTLYASDTLLFLRSGELYSVGAAFDVAELVRQAKWDVSTVFAHHMRATPWASVLAALSKSPASR